MSTPDQEQAITKAREFADRAHSVEVNKLTRERQERIAQSRNMHAAHGSVLSGNAVRDTTIIYGEQITALLRSRLNLLLEGFELHRVSIDDHLVERVVKELTELRSTWIANARRAFALDAVMGGRLLPEGIYMQMLEENVGMSSNEIRTHLERRRLMPKKIEGSTSISVYHIQGSNNRWLTNSQDYSVNVVTQSSDQIFATLRQEIESKVPAGDERKDILDKLQALEQSENSPSFKQRYTEFISAAANHMVLIAPFIPALTEMLHKAL